MVAAGFDSEEVIHVWPYDRFLIFSAAVVRREAADRHSFAVGVAQAIGGAFGSKGLKEYLETLEKITDMD